MNSLKWFNFYDVSKLAKGHSLHNVSMVFISILIKFSNVILEIFMEERM